MTHDTNTDSGAHTLIAAGRSALAGGAQTVRDTGAEIRHAAAVAVDARRGSVATRLDDIAHGLHGSADSVTTTAADVGHVTHGAARTVEGAARYVRDHDARDMAAHVGALVRAHPGKTLLGVMAVGYLAALVLHRTRRA
jgi:hypothetical protein